MSLTIHLSPAVEARLAVAAKKSGVAPAELVENIVDEHLRASESTSGENRDGRIDQRVDRDLTDSTADISTMALFDQWAKEDSLVTEEDLAENERIYGEIERNGIPRVRL